MCRRATIDCYIDTGANGGDDRELSHGSEIGLKRRQLALENDRFRVFRDDIADSQGNEVRGYLVVAPRTRRPDLITGVCVLPVWNGRIILLRNFRHAIGAVQLEGVRGFVDDGEDPADAALRELTEETGLRCAREDLIGLGLCTPEGSTLAARIALFAAADCKPGDKAPQTELGLGQPEYFTLSEALLKMHEMSIEDVSTSLALHRFFLTRGL